MSDSSGNGFFYGLRDIKLTNIAGSTQVDLPAAQELSWSESVVNDTLRGDDVKKSIISFVDGGEFSFKSGGISLEAYAILTGETITSTGTTPSRTDTLVRTGGQAYPYFKIYGNALGENAEGIHVLLHKCKLTKLEGKLGDKEFFITDAAGEFVEDDSGDLYTIIKLETNTAVPAT